MRSRYEKSTEDYALSNAVSSSFRFLLREWGFELGRSEYGVFFDHFEFTGKSFNLEIHIEKREREVDLSIATCDIRKPLTTLSVYEGERVRKYLTLWLRDNHVQLPNVSAQSEGLTSVPIGQRDTVYLTRMVEFEAKVLSNAMPTIIAAVEKMPRLFS